MTEEMTEDKNEEELNEGNPLFAEVSDAILNVVRTASLEEQIQLAGDLAAWVVTIARWVGYATAIDKAKQIVEETFAKAEQIRKEIKENNE